MKKILVETQDQLIEFCTQIQSSAWLAIDTEFIREKTYYPKLCLLQVADDNIAGCVDTLALEDLSSLMKILFNRNTTKIFHACHQDLEIFAHLNKSIPSPIFDTQIAGALIGLGNQEGYASAVRKLLSVSLDKSQTRTNWAHRPLDDEQLEYAFDDVIYLGKLYQAMRVQLNQADRLDWLNEDFAELEQPEFFINTPMEMWSKVKGYQQLKGVQLSILQLLAARREQRAQELDIPRRWVMSDEIIQAIAKQMPSTTKNLSKIRGIKKSTIEKEGQEILTLIQSAQKTPKAQWPQHTNPLPKLSSSQEAFVDVLMAVVRLKAEEQNINALTLAKRKDLEKLVLGETPETLMTGWKKSLIGEPLMAVLSGKTVIQVENGQIRIQT